MRSFACVIGITTICLAAWACGGESGDDGMMVVGDECEDGVKASDDWYLPYRVGNIWQYRVTKVGDLEPGEKRTELVEELTPEGETEPVIVQRTVKPEGATVSWLRVEGDIIVRLRQEDYDATGALQRATTYDPPRIRFDGTTAHTANGATFVETYNATVVDAFGVETSSTEVSEAWTIVGVDVPCAAGFAELRCLHVRRERIVGGVANKEYYFARGYGKVLETGGQTEELVGCKLQ